MNIKKYLQEGTGYNVVKEKTTTAHLMSTLLIKAKRLSDSILDSNSVNPSFYMGLTGEIKRLHLLLDHIEDLIKEFKDDTGERF